MVIGASLSDAECHVILWVSCFPTFLPIIRLFSTGGRPGRVLQTLSTITGLNTLNGQEQLRSQDGNRNMTHIVTNNRESAEEREEIELGELGEAGFRKDNIVKSTVTTLDSGG
jgi:hypothetical protein